MVSVDINKNLHWKEIMHKGQSVYVAPKQLLCIYVFAQGRISTLEIKYF